MSKQFEEAPPLPRQPTAISVPEAMATAAATENPSLVEDPVSELPVDAHALPPPPKFPSLTDVALPNASAAAATLSPPTEAPLPTDPDLTPYAAAPHTAPPTVEPEIPSYDSQPVPASLPVLDNPTPTTATEQTIPTDPSVDAATPSAASRPLSETVRDDIAAAIERDAVTPGTGAKKAVEIGQKLWTPNDQQELERLLKEGQAVYVPPDVDRDDMPVLRHGAYIPVPVSGDQVVPGVDESPNQRSVAARVAAWNQVVPEESDQSSRGGIIAAAPVPVPLPGDSVEQATSRAIDDTAAQPAAGDDATRDLEQAATTTPTTTAEETEDAGEAAHEGATAPADSTEAAATDRSATPGEGATTTSKSADVTRTIFGGRFVTVPVTYRKGAPAASEPQGENSEMVESTTEVKLKSENKAKIDITHDYGLKGGHASGVNDAAFLNDDTLVTCGNDGKVCVWDMRDRSVESEFVPYGGEAVSMVYPMPQEDTEQSKTIMTLSKSRLMRIWSVDERQAVLLRTTQIQQSDKDLYMSVPVISKELKAWAASAAAAAAVTTTDAPEMPAEATPTAAVTEAAPETAAAEPAADTGAVETTGAEPTTAEAAAAADEEKEKKRFSFTKVLSFGRSSTRKTPAAAT